MVDATISVLDRGSIHADRNFALDAEVVATRSNRDPDLRYDEFPVWNLVIDHPEATVLWDSGSHPQAGDGHWPEPLFEAFFHENAAERGLETALDEEGYALEDVDVVVQSHLHLDHAGGLHNFDGTDVPVYVHEEEIKHAYYCAKTSKGSEAYLPGDFDYDLNWKIVHGDRRLLEGVELLHLPGHTPGLLGAQIHLEGQSVLIAGDEAFYRENYEAGRAMGASLLSSKRDWFDSLQRLKALERRHDAEVLFGHDLEQFREVRDGWPR